MRDFLIDTNIWEYWFNPKREPQHSNVLKRVAELKQQSKNGNNPFRIWISSVTWGEIEFGYRVQTNKDGSLEKQFRRFINDIAPKEFLIDKHVTQEYGRIRAKLFEKYSPKYKRVNGRRPEQLIDPVTSLQLTIQENDLWIVSQAITRDFTLKAVLIHSHFVRFCPFLFLFVPFLSLFVPFVPKCAPFFDGK